MRVSGHPGERRAYGLRIPAVPREDPVFLEPKGCGDRAAGHGEAQAGVMG